MFKYKEKIQNLNDTIEILQNKIDKADKAAIIDYSGTIENDTNYSDIISKLTLEKNTLEQSLLKKTNEINDINITLNSALFDIEKTKRELVTDLENQIRSKNSIIMILETNINDLKADIQQWELKSSNWEQQRKDHEFEYQSILSKLVSEQNENNNKSMTYMKKITTLEQKLEKLETKKSLGL